MSEYQRQGRVHCRHHDRGAARRLIARRRSPSEAEFFSFGTNDLTQITFGLSRDDAGKFLPDYVEQRHLPGRSLRRLDLEGVGSW